MAERPDNQKNSTITDGSSFKGPIALLQLNSSNVIEDNIKDILSLIEEAVNGGAKFIATPECSHLMEMNRASVLEKTYFEDDDPGLKALCQSAADHGVYILIGSLVIKSDDARLVNRSLLINAVGDIVARYDKIHLFDVDLAGGESYHESALYDAGREGVVASVSDTDLGLNFDLGMSICYDLRFGYLFRDYASAGASILSIPAAFTVQTGEAHWHSLLRARAIETGCYVIAPAQVGLHKTGRSTYGHSLVVDPWGEVVAELKDGVGVLFAEIDLAKVSEARQRVPSLQHTRNVKVFKY